MAKQNKPKLHKLLLLAILFVVGGSINYLIAEFRSFVVHMSSPIPDFLLWGSLPLLLIMGECIILFFRSTIVALLMAVIFVLTSFLLLGVANMFPGKIDIFLSCLSFFPGLFISYIHIRWYRYAKRSIISLSDNQLNSFTSDTKEVVVNGQAISNRNGDSRECPKAEKNLFLHRFFAVIKSILIENVEGFKGRKQRSEAKKSHPRAKDCLIISFVSVILIGCTIVIYLGRSVRTEQYLFDFSRYEMIIIALLLISLLVQAYGIILGLYSLAQIKRDSTYGGVNYAISGILISLVSAILILSIFV